MTCVGNTFPAVCGPYSFFFFFKTSEFQDRIFLFVY